MMKSRSLHEIIQRINNRKRRSQIYTMFIGLMRSLLLAGFTVGIWEIIRPGSLFEEIVIFFVCVVFGLLTSAKKGKRQISPETFAKYLEFTYPKAKHSAFDLLDGKERPEVFQAWQDTLELEVDKHARHDARENRAYASTIVMPLLMLIAVFSMAPQSIGNVFSGVKSVVSRLQWGVELEIIDGMAEDSNTQRFELKTSNPLSLVLLEQNLIKIDLVGERRGVRHVVVLKPLQEGKTSQSFQLIETLGSKRDDTETGVFSLSFSVNQSAELYISSISESRPLATIEIRKLPVPQVVLESVFKPMKDPWPDDVPLKLQITTKAENPLDKIRLLIQSEGRVSTELVANIMAEDKYETTAEYDLVLEPYMNADIAEVVIIAEVTDRSLPKPLVGRSDPLRVTAASAYGRYQRTLQTLRELKALFDHTVEENRDELDSKARDVMAEAQVQAQDSPFFDQFDRAKLFSFDRRTNQIIQEFSKEEALELSTEINEFLFEHEAIDFRERDRDFFVAIRGLSRLLEQTRKERPVKVEQVTKRVTDFLEERKKIWDMRVSRLPEDRVPQAYNRIKKRDPFVSALNKVIELDAKNEPASDAEALQILSQTATEYRNWIQELEKAEDEAKQQKEAERQQGLSSARNQLKELQKRQSEISSILDQADKKKTEDLADEWPSTRMKQTTNTETARRLENMLRSLSPLGAKRMEAAVEMMKSTVEYGDESRFESAESASDAAARLLRQAESAAQKSQQSSGNSRGRRRRVSGDNYYGRSVTGGDIEINRGYSVDQRYRGEILEEVRSMQGQESISRDEKNLMESYLRKIVR